MTAFGDKWRKSSSDSQGSLASVWKKDESGGSIGGARLIQSNREKQKLAIQSQTQKYLEEFEETQSGWKGALNRFLGRGVAKPNLVNTYTSAEEKKKAASEFRTQKLEEAEMYAKRADALSHPFRTAKDFLTYDSTRSAYDVFQQKNLDKQSLALIEKNNQDAVKYAELMKNAKTQEEKQKYRRYIDILFQANKKIAEQVGGELKNKTKLQLAGQSLGTALDLTPFLGFSSLGAKVGTKIAGKTATKFLGKQIRKNITKDVLTEGGLFGGMAGLSGGIQQQNPTIKNVATSTALGVGAGITLAGGLFFSGKGISKLAKLGIKKLEELSKAIREKKVSQKEVESIFKEEGIEGVERKINEVVPEKKGILQIAKEKKAKTAVSKGKNLSKETAEQTALRMKKEGGTFDDFVKTQENLKHGTKKEITELRKINPEKGKAFYLSKPGQRKAEAIAGKKGVVQDFYLDTKKAKTLDPRYSDNAEANKIVQEAIDNVYGKNKYVYRPDAPYEKGNIINKVDDILQSEVIRIGNKKGYNHFRFYEPSAKEYSHAITDKNLIKTKSQLTEIWNKSQPPKEAKKGILQTAREKKLSQPTKTAVSKSDPLIQQAKKYKSAEEFVKAQENVVGEKLYLANKEAKKIRDEVNKIKEELFETEPKYARDPFSGEWFKDVDEFDEYVSDNFRFLDDGSVEDVFTGEKYSKKEWMKQWEEPIEKSIEEVSEMHEKIKAGSDYRQLSDDIYKLKEEIIKKTGAEPVIVHRFAKDDYNVYPMYKIGDFEFHNKVDLDDWIKQTGKEIDIDDLPSLEDISSEVKIDKIFKEEDLDFLRNVEIKTKSQLTEIWNKAQKETREVAKPKKKVVEGKKSKLAQRINENLPEEYKISEFYDEKTIKKELSKASEDIAKDKDKALREAFDKDTEPLQRITKLMEFAQIAKSNKDFNAQNALLSRMRKEGTETAQALNMFKAYELLNPETNFMKAVVNARIKKVAFGVSDIKKAREQVARKITEIAKDIKKKTQKAYKVADAQKLFNKLVC